MSHKAALVEALKDPKTWVSPSDVAETHANDVDLHACIQRLELGRNHFLLLPYLDDWSRLQGSNCSM